MKTFIIMRVAGSVSAIRDMRVTLRSVKRDVRVVREDVEDMTNKMGEMTAHVQSLTVKLDRHTALMTKCFIIVLMLLGGMLFLIQTNLWLHIRPVM